MDRPKRRKLLVASIGVATVSYAMLACGKNQAQDQPPGNLAVYIPPEGGPQAPTPVIDSGAPPKDGSAG
jgi:hypothetical protein